MLLQPFNHTTQETNKFLCFQFETIKASHLVVLGKEIKNIQIHTLLSLIHVHVVTSWHDKLFMHTYTLIS
jgi:hypothetical protein